MVVSKEPWAELPFSFASVVVEVAPPLNHHPVYGDSQHRIGCSSSLFVKLYSFTDCVIFRSEFDTST